VVRRLRVPVCYDLRQADLIAGGQGAPITPLSDWVLYRRAGTPLMVANLGGICNVTYLDGAGLDTVHGEDACPCNILLDGLVRELFPGAEFDEGGALARRGRANEEFAWVIADHPFFRGPPRSAGREDFTPDWVRSVIARRTEGMSAHDLLASAVEFVAGYVAGRQSDVGRRYRVVLAGGGAKNAYLVERIRARCKSPEDVVLSDELGVPIEAREAVGFAVLGALSQDGVPITLPRVTGSTAPARAGAWVYP
jgi:anhydro-N-acetylmuramic acid kinase